MHSSPSLNKCNPTNVVDKRIGDAFWIVNEVYKNLAYLKTLSEQLNDLMDVSVSVMAAAEQTELLHDETEDMRDQAAASETAAGVSAVAAQASQVLALASETAASGFSSSANTSALVAAAAQSSAEDARDVVLAINKLYPNTTAGIAGTLAGEYFAIPSPLASGYLDLYLNDSGSPLLIKTYPSLDAINAVLGLIRENEKSDGVVWSDLGGFVFAAITLLGKLTTNSFTADGTGLVGKDGFKVTKDGLYLDAGTYLSYNSNIDGFVFTDRAGFIYLSISATGEINYIEKQGTTQTWTEQDISEKNLSALAYGESVKQQSSTLTPYPSTDWVVFVMYGQSLALGTEGWPALSKTPKYGNKMYGACARPNNTTSATFTPVGSNQLFDLIATCQDETTAAVLSDAAVAALSQGDNATGESPLEGWVNGVKRLYNLSGGSDRVFIGINCAVGGKTIAELSKGASPNLYGRYTSALTGLKALADAAGKTLSVHSVAYFQGERDYVLNTSLSSYKSALGQLQSDFIADAKAITGQVDSPLFMTYQTGGSYTNDTQDMAVGNAQLDASNEKNNYVLATPNYQVFDKGDHLDPNGYRWMGCQLAKVWEKLVLQRQGWKPLQPLSAQLKGKEILVNFHVPCPPLQFGYPWVGLTSFEGEGLEEKDYINKGFRVLDNTNTLQTIASVELVAECVVLIRLNTIPSNPIRVLYGTKTSTNGNGCLMDSDLSIADENYEYNSGTGQYSVANIPELLNKPYPLNNWCVAFVKNVVEV